MPVYNGEPYLSDAINSILSQTMTDFELIISDNASTDRTEDICREFARQDERIRYVRNTENVGAAGNYNKVFELARAEYFRWSNADDLFEPILHEKCIAFLDNNPAAVLAYGKTKIIDEFGNVTREYEDDLDLQQKLGSDRFLDFFRRVGLTNAIYGLMRADAMRKTNLFGDGTLPAVDTRFMAELTLQGKFIEIPEVLFYRRMHAEASSSDRADTEKQQQFWKPRSGGFRMAKTRLYTSYFRSISQAPIGIGEKLRLFFFIAKWTIASLPAIAGETYEYLQERINAQRT